MGLGSRAWAASVAAGWSVLAVCASAQTTGSVDLGVSTVHYDGFLPSGAVAITPAVRWQGALTGVSAGGTYLRYESGHESLQGAVTGWRFTAGARARWRGEFDVDAGASRYLDFASFWHGVAGARLHVLGEEHGAWVGVAAGATSYGGAALPVTTVGAGAWSRLSWLLLRVSGNRFAIGDTTYTDLESSGHADRGRVVLDATLGARVWSRGGGRGVYGEGSVAISLSEPIALVLGAGRYPTDPVRGSLAARYLSAALSLHPSRPRRVAVRHAAVSSDSGADRSSALPVVRLEVRAAPHGAVRLAVYAPGAARVELAGDFTDWQPVPLTQEAEGSWAASFEIATGIHRVNVRIDGVSWIVPGGVARSTDEFGGDVGTFVVP